MSKTRMLSESLFDYGYFKVPIADESLKKEILWSLEIFQMYFSKSFKDKRFMIPRGWDHKGYRFKRDDKDLMIKESFTFSIVFLKEFLSSGDYVFGGFVSTRLQDLISRIHENFMDEIFQAFNLTNGIKRTIEGSAASWSVSIENYINQKGFEIELPSSKSKGLFTALMYETCPGTEFKTQNVWEPVSPNYEGEMCPLFYAGKELEKITDGEVKAVEHRSIIPPGGRMTIKVFPDHY